MYGTLLSRITLLVFSLGSVLTERQANTKATSLLWVYNIFNELFTLGKWASLLWVLPPYLRKQMRFAFTLSFGQCEQTLER